MITLSIITETLWTIITIPHRIWKSNYYTLSYEERNGVKIVFGSYLILISMFLLFLISSI